MVTESENRTTVFEVKSEVHTELILTKKNTLFEVNTEVNTELNRTKNRFPYEYGSEYIIK